MKTKPIHSTLLFIISLLFASCSTPPPPESEWNRAGVWKKVSDEPATYVPSGYASTSPRDESTGVWFTDKADGKRVFVPSAGTEQYKYGVLVGEADKVTGKYRPTAVDNALLYGVGYPIAISFLIAVEMVMAVGSAG